MSAPNGWMAVPLEPTKEMVAAARKNHEGEWYLPYSLYAAMIKAAPAAPAQPVSIDSLSHTTKLKMESLAKKGMTVCGVVMTDDTGQRATIDMGRVEWTPAQPVPSELRKAFMTLESHGNSEGRTIVLKFNHREDAYIVHEFLLKVPVKELPSIKPIIYQD